ncbi:phosphate transport system permease protein PstC [Fibrobacterales bacterium]|nr:phosphate transport system permease protein PstC [Fibrobacterales bacterium]
MKIYSKISSKFLSGGWFISLIRVSAVAIILLMLAIAVMLTLGALPAIKHFGFGFLVGGDWNPIENNYGALPFLVGTLITSFLALVISIPFSIAIAIILGEFNPTGKVSALFTSLVELLAGIPSVIFGFFALFYLVPLVRFFQIKFNIIPYGVGIFTSSLILAIMIIPFSASLGRQIIKMVPSGLKEAAYALGATRFEVLKDVVFPVARSGILAGFILALGRALGETMAVTMVIGNNNALPHSIFDLGNTISSIIANEFAEAGNALHFSSLTYLGLALFVGTAAINLAGKYAIKKMAKM